MIQDALVARLAALDSCAVSDALDKLGLDGVAFGLRALSLEKRIAGRAITISLGMDDGRSTSRHLGTSAVEASGPGDVIVVAHDARMEISGWGGILSLGASRKGAEGVIVDGACRDVDEARDMGLPVYARAGVPRTARGRVIETGWNEPVSIAGIAVAPGDLVIADGSGIVFIPADRAGEVVTIAETIVRKEQLMAAAVRGGDPISQVMGTNYENMLKESSQS